MGSGDQAAHLRDIILALQPVEPIGRGDLYSFVERFSMNGRGVGWMDAGIVAACLASDPPVSLYTRDRRMAALAVWLGVSVVEPGDPA